MTENGVLWNPQGLVSLCLLDLDFAGVEDARSEEPILSGEADTPLPFWEGRHSASGAAGAARRARPAPGKAPVVINLRLPHTANLKPGCCHFLLFPLVGGVSWVDSQNLPS